MMDLKDAQRQIEQRRISMKVYNKTKRSSKLRKAVGEERMGEVINFQKVKQEKTIDDKTRESAGENFLHDLENFKERKGYRR